MRKIMTGILCVCIALFMVSCGANNGSRFQPGYIDEQTNDVFNEIIENDFIKTSKQSTSNISLSANTASYAMLRKQIESNGRISKDMVRIEEMINYFKYTYQKPEGQDVLNAQSTVIQTPWNKDTQLLFVGMQAQDIQTTSIENNIVFLLDVSGSMSTQDKLPLIQQSMPLLLEHLNGNDRVSIVTYASQDKILLDGEPASNKLKIEAVISDLYASGGTAGSKGIQTAYELAQKHFIEGGNNRVILATDGDFNVGIRSQSQLKSFISEKKETGIYLSVFGFGMGNLNDNKLETLAQAGNGNHAYIDTLLEAKKALIEDINGTLYTVARDAKAQINFNPEVVDAYRLIGYENRQLSDDEFNDDDTDAGEIGAGHQVTVVYELKLNETDQRKVADFTLKYKQPDITQQAVFTKVTTFNKDSKDILENDALFISAVVEFGLLLRDSRYKGSASIEAIMSRVNSLSIDKMDDYQKDFIRLLDKYQSNQSR